MIRYDDSNLRKLFADMEPSQRKKALKGAFRREANRIRKVAVNNLRATGINHAQELSRGIRAVVFKRDAGFRVTAASRKSNKQGKGERGMHKNRYGLKKPVLAWAETGTRWRMVKSTRAHKVKIKGRWVTVGKHRGFMRRYGFIKQTKAQVEGTVTESLRKEIADSVIKTAKKYGCT